MRDNEHRLYEENKGIHDKPPPSFFLKETLEGSSNIAKYGIKGDWRCLTGIRLSKSTSLWETNEIRGRM